MHFHGEIPWKCMFIVCLNIFSSILPPLQDVSYVKVHVYCVFDYALFNLASNSVCKLRESACLLCVWLFSLQSCLHFRLWVTWKCMFIVYLTIFTTSDRDELFAMLQHIHSHALKSLFLFYNRRRVPLVKHTMKLSTFQRNLPVKVSLIRL